MTLKEIQKEVDTWAQQFKTPYWKPHEILARTTEEIGELARLINHEFGPKKKKLNESKQEMGEEIVDIMFALICLANSQDIDLDKSFEKVMNKCYVRDKDRFEKRV